MTSWAGDKKEILSKLSDLYQDIGTCVNRYDASRVLLRELEFLTKKLIADDPIITDMITLDREWFDMYFIQMSELMGEEK